ncbi:MAG: hypothetical protein EOM20_14290 [Spartobacteria bacterium]|nr:hypothetical protein [Spartobacteria bacterium]
MTWILLIFQMLRNRSLEKKRLSHLIQWGVIGDGATTISTPQKPIKGRGSLSRRQPGRLLYRLQPVAHGEPHLFWAENAKKQQIFRENAKILSKMPIFGPEKPQKLAFFCFWLLFCRLLHIFVACAARRAWQPEGCTTSSIFSRRGSLLYNEHFPVEDVVAHRRRIPARHAIMLEGDIEVPIVGEVQRGGGEGQTHIKRLDHVAEAGQGLCVLEACFIIVWNRCVDVPINPRGKNIR